MRVVFDTSVLVAAADPAVERASRGQLHSVTGLRGLLIDRLVCRIAGCPHAARASAARANP